MSAARRQWPIKRIGDLATVARGSSPRPIVDQRYFDGGDIPWIKIADATKSGKYLYQTKEHVNEFGASFSRRLPIGSLIVAASGTLGYTQMLGVSGCVHDGWLYLTDFRGVDKHYLYYFFQWKKEHFYNSAYGAAIQNINTEILRETEVALPPLPVQERIASILSAYDDLIENNTRRIKILEQMAQMLYREWFVNFRFPGHENVKMVESELGPIPEGWAVERLETVVEEFIDYRGKTPKKLGGDWSERGILALSALNVKQGRLVSLEKAKFVSDELYKRWMKSELRAGDILMTSEAPLGEVYFLPETRQYCLSQRVFSIRSKATMMQPSLLFFVLSSPEGQKELKSRASGTTVSGIRQADLRRIPVVRPPAPLQQDGDLMLRPFLMMIDVLQRKVDVLRRTRDLLLPKLISGEIPVEVAADLTEQTA